MNSTRHCWCGQTDLADFSPEYFRCENCQTLVVKKWPAPNQFEVSHDKTDFYGRSYYESHLAHAYGYPDLPDRARNDLNERCMHWMRTTLKYRLPPGRALELGSAHGGFVALMRWAGFDAAGLELSPWLVEYAKSQFGIPMLTGPIEKQNIEPASLNMILHFDVLEHLPDPRATMQRCMDLLKADGLMIFQTPRFPADRTYEEMLQNNDRFLEQLKTAEHLYMFSQESIARFFAEIGAPFIYFEKAIFDYYDMFAVISRCELTPHTEEEATKALLARPDGRMVQALLDANAQYKRLVRRYDESEADRGARLQLLENAETQIKDINAHHEATLRLLREAESERKALKRVLLKMDASYKRQMSHGLARLLRRLQAPLKMDALFKAMEERLASNSGSDGANAAP